ncbi:hypothetical protein P5V15_009728 [Pogonomyrmex californicus]
MSIRNSALSRAIRSNRSRKLLKIINARRRDFSTNGPRENAELAIEIGNINGSHSLLARKTQLYYFHKSVENGTACTLSSSCACRYRASLAYCKDLAQMLNNIARKVANLRSGRTSYFFFLL